VATAYRAMPPLVEQIPPNKQCFQEKYARCGVVYLLATPWGRITDPVGKGEPLDWRQRTVRCRRWWNRYRLTAVFPGKVRAVRRRLPINDPMGNDYRPCGERIPTLGGDFYRPCGERIPTFRGDFTDRVGVDYRPYGETRRIKSLQRVAFGLAPSVYMMLCLCLVFCLVNREVIGG
jgi:hypothetical protein